MAFVEPLSISLNDALKLDSTHVHAAHCLLYFPSGNEIFGLMQMRSDGRIGFPGGGVDVLCPSQDDLVEALNRELMEEINYDGSVTLDSYIMSHLHLNRVTGKKLITHFFMKSISAEEGMKIEREHTKAPYFPLESLGLFRVPVFSEDSPNFLMNFSQHKFAGNARDQLLEAFNIIRSLTPISPVN